MGRCVFLSHELTRSEKPQTPGSFTLRSHQQNDQLSQPQRPLPD